MFQEQFCWFDFVSKPHWFSVKRYLKKGIKKIRFLNIEYSRDQKTNIFFIEYSRDQKTKSKHLIRKKNKRIRFESLYSFLPAQLQELCHLGLKKD